MIEHVLHTVQVKDVVLTTFKLNNFHYVIKPLETYGTLCGFSKKYIAKRKVPHVFDEFSFSPCHSLAAGEELLPLKYAHCQDE